MKAWVQRYPHRVPPSEPGEAVEGHRDPGERLIFFANSRLKVEFAGDTLEEDNDSAREPIEGG